MTTISDKDRADAQALAETFAGTTLHALPDDGIRRWLAIRNRVLAWHTCPTAPVWRPTTVEVASASLAKLSALVSYEAFAVRGIELYELDDDDYGIAIDNQSSHSYVIIGTPDQLMQLAGQITTIARTIKSKENTP